MSYIRDGILAKTKHGQLASQSEPSGEGREMEEDPSGAAYLVKPVHIVGQQVDNLACGGLPHGGATQAEVTEIRRETENRMPKSL